MTTPGRVVFGAATGALVLVTGCGPAVSDPTNSQTATTTGTPADSGAAQRERTLEILEEVYAQLEASDKPPLEDQKTPGEEAICSLDESDPTTAWTEIVFLPVESPEEDAARARGWLAGQGYEQIRSRQDGTITTHHADGYTVTVAEYADGRVELNVESPCTER